MKPFAASIILLLIPVGLLAQGNPDVQSIAYVDGLKYTTVQAALNAVSAGGTVIVPAGTWAQGSTALTISGVSLKCEHGAIITFNGLGSTVDAVTIQGWVGSEVYPLEVDGCTFITSASGTASGRDLIQISGGNHIRVSNLVLRDPGRDTIHVEPASNFSWIENLTLDNIESSTCGNVIPGCTGTIVASSNLRDDLNFSLGDKFSTALTNVFINEVTVSKLNLRAHTRYGEHFYENNSCSGCAMQNYVFLDTHTDSAGRAAASSNPDVYLEIGSSGGRSQTNAITWVNGDSEDTGNGTRTGKVFKANGASVGTGFQMLGYSYANFSGLFDTNFFTDTNNSVFFAASNSQINATSTAWWKDGSPSQAAAFGLAIPGAPSNGNDGCVFIYDGGTWTKRACAAAAGGFNYYGTGGSLVAAVDNAGTVNGSLFATRTNCAANGTTANPSVVSCHGAAAGMFSCSAKASTGTCQVNTTAVTANSEIFITQDAADGGTGQLNVTCNTNNVVNTSRPLLASKAAGTGFTISLGTVTTNPACFEYYIVN